MNGDNRHETVAMISELSRIPLSAGVPDGVAQSGSNRFILFSEEVVRMSTQE